MPFTDKDGHLTEAFQKEKHDTARKLLKNRRTETEVLADKISLGKIDKFGSVW